MGPHLAGAADAGSPAPRPPRPVVCGDGPPVLFLNGLFQSIPSWDFVRRHLPDGFSHICVDFPNQGEGPAEPAYAEFRAYCDFAEALLAELALRAEDVAVVGFSFGAEVARALVHDRGLRFRRLVLGSLSPPGLGNFWREWFTTLAAVADRGEIELFVRTIAFHMYSPSFFERFPKAMTVMRLRYSEYFAHDPRSLALLARAPLSRDFEREQREADFGCPTHIVSPTHDNLIPHDMSAAYAARTGARHHSVPAGHTFIVEAPEATARIVLAALEERESRESEDVRQGKTSDAEATSGRFCDLR